VRARHTVLALGAVLIATLAGAESAGACSCAYLPPKELKKRADGAFNGRLLSVRLVEGTSEAAFRYRVGQVFKGRGRLRRGKVVTVWSQDDEAACGLPQRTGIVYGLFLSRGRPLDFRALRGGLTPQRCGAPARRKLRGWLMPSAKR
jgi:hypothetical protein